MVFAGIGLGRMGRLFIAQGGQVGEGLSNCGFGERF
jgi:hypothetical protein